MRLTVRHATIYTHDSPLRFIAQSHRLTPAANAAQRILDWRTEHGRFTAVEELGEVSGIGDKIYAQLAPKVTV